MAGIPQVITEDRASGAQFIDGSLKFDSGKIQYLKRTFPSAGNQRTYTFSVWLKRASGFGAFRAILTTLSSDGTSNTGAWIGSGDGWYYFFGNSNFYNSARARDTGWYHVVYRLDTTIASPDSDRLRVYVNGNLMPWNTSTSQAYPTLNEVDLLNSAASHSIGRRDSSNEHHFDGSMSQFYFIDGQSLGPENFGYTDPLTNTWRPKKYTGSFAGPAFGYSGTIPTSMTNVAPAGSYGNGIATAAELFGGTLLENGDNHIRQDGGGFEWSAAIPLSNGDVAGAQCLYFNNTSSHGIQFKINGSWVTVQENAQNVIGSTQGQGALITYTASGSVNWTGVKAISGSNISVTTVAGIFVNGELVGPQTTPPNGFYLPMDGNSPIGQDQSGNGNDWTPVNFGGSVELDNPNVSGARPILNTDGGSNVARPGVFGSEVGFRDNVSG